MEKMKQFFVILAFYILFLGGYQGYLYYNYFQINLFNFIAPLEIFNLINKSIIFIIITIAFAYPVGFIERELIILLITAIKYLTKSKASGKIVEIFQKRFGYDTVEKNFGARVENYFVLQPKLSLILRPVLYLILAPISFAYFWTQVECKHVKEEKAYYGTRFWKTGEVYFSDSTKYFIGVTNNYLFEFDEKTNSPTIHRMADVSKINIIKKDNGL